MSDDDLCVTLGDMVRERYVLTVGVLTEETAGRSLVDARPDEPRIRLGMLTKTVSTGMSECEVLAALGEPLDVSRASYRGPIGMYPAGSNVRFVHMDGGTVDQWSD